MASTPASTASDRPSASTSRPSASVLSTSTVLPLRILRTSPGLMAAPARHVLGGGDDGDDLHRPGARAGRADIAASTAAAPDLSVFIVSMPSAVLSDRPPESKVIPLPTRAIVPVAARRVVDQADEAGRLVGPQGHAGQAAQALVDDGDLVEDVDLQALVLRHLGGDLGQPPGGHGARRLVDHVAGEGHRPGDPDAALDRPSVGVGARRRRRPATRSGTPWGRSCRW